MKPRLSVAMGITKVIFGVVWVILGVTGMVYGVRGVRWVGNSISQAIEELQLSIEVVNSLLTETIDVFDMVDQSLATVEGSTINAAIAMGELVRRLAPI